MKNQIKKNEINLEREQKDKEPKQKDDFFSFGHENPYMKSNIQNFHNGEDKHIFVKSCHSSVCNLKTRRK